MLDDINKERIRLQKEIDLLKRRYEYYDQFNFSEELGNAIAFLINEFENKDCVCKKIVCEIPEHTELVSRHFLGKDQLVTKRFSKKNFSFIVVVDKEFTNQFENLKFGSFEEMKNLLEISSLFFVKYDGLLDLEMFGIVFPYLNMFFQSLNEWRYRTGRVTFDEDILSETLLQVLNYSSVKQDFKVRI